MELSVRSTLVYFRTFNFLQSTKPTEVKENPLSQTAGHKTIGFEPEALLHTGYT